MFNQQLLAGRRILVTGGGTGLGKSMAARFLELGAEVHICGRRKGVCDETATELMDTYGGKVMSHGVDIRDPAAVDAMIEAIFVEGPLTDLIALGRELLAPTLIAGETLAEATRVAFPDLAGILQPNAGQQLPRRLCDRGKGAVAMGQQRVGVAKIHLRG